MTVTQTTPIVTALETAREMTIAEICTSFIDDELIATSSMTQLWYRCRLGLFVEAMGPDRALSSIGKKELLAWWRSLDARTRTEPPTLAIETFHGYVRAVRRLFKHLDKQHMTLIPLGDTLKLPKLPERQHKGVDDKDVAKLIDAAASNPRDLAIILFMESTGARRGGVCSLKLDSINPDAPEPYCRRATVNEKGLKVRNVIMSAEALEALRAWLAVRQSDTDFVFTDNRPGKDRGMLPGAINQILARYKKLLGIKGHCSPHQWRHRFSRCLLKSGMPLNITSQLLGHSSTLVTAMYYGNLLGDELQVAYDKYYSPPGTKS